MSMFEAINSMADLTHLPPESYRFILFQTTALRNIPSHAITLPAQHIIEHYRAIHRVNTNLFPNITEHSLFGILHAPSPGQVFLRVGCYRAGQDITLSLNDDFFRSHQLVVRTATSDDFHILKLQIPVNDLYFSPLSKFDNASAASQQDNKFREIIRSSIPTRGYHKLYAATVFDPLSAKLTFPESVESTEKSTLVLALDYDDVLSALKDTLGDIMANVKQLLHEAIRDQRLSLKNIKKLVVVIASSRQGRHLDEANQHNSRPASAFLIFPEVIRALHHIFSPLRIPVLFDPITISDVLSQSEAGQALKETLENKPLQTTLRDDPAAQCFEKRKFLLVWLHMMRQANALPLDEKIDFLVVEDEEKIIIPNLYKVFSAHPEYIPRNMTLRIQRYCKVSPEPRLSYVFQGTGDTHPDPVFAVRQTLLHLLEKGIAKKILSEENGGNGIFNLLMSDSDEDKQTREAILYFLRPPSSKIETETQATTSIQATEEDEDRLAATASSIFDCLDI